MYQFNYHKPDSLDEAAQLLAASEDSIIVAGGMTLIPTMKQHLAQYSALVDLASIDELNGISESEDGIRIGAMTTHTQVQYSELVQNKIPALSYLAQSIGDSQVRNRGTIGGSIANADPAADYPAGLVGLAATIHTNQRDIASDDFFTAMFETALAETEIVTAISFPVPEKVGYAKFANQASRYAVVAVMVSKTAGQSRVAVTGAAASVFRMPQMEQSLNADFSPGAVRSIDISADDLNSDIHASAKYRAHLVGVIAARAVEAAG